MNKTELTQQTKLDTKTLDAVLSAAGIAKNLADYTDDHLKLIQAIQAIRQDTSITSWAEAVGIHRKPEREAQLHEIAVRRAIPDDRIPEILGAMKLKLEALTEPQIELFAKVCAMVQTGMDLNLAAQAVLDEAKAAKAKKPLPELVTQPEPEGALAVATQNAIIAQIPEGSEATLRDVARTAVTEASVGNISDRMADIAVDVVDEIDSVARQMIIEAIFGQDSEFKPDPDRAAARVREIRRQRGQR